MPRVSRTIQYYTLNARSGENLLNYDAFLYELSAMKSKNRTITVSEDLAICISKITKFGQGEYAFNILAGDPEDSPIILDLISGQVESIDLGSEKFVATTSNAALKIDGDTRIFSLEVRRNGISKTSLERYFSLISEQLMQKRYTFDLVPLAGKRFFEELDAFSVVKEVSITITRPNKSWRSMESKLEDLGEASGAHRVDLTMRAERGGGLNQNDGVLEVLHNEGSLAKAKIQDATVIGIMPGVEEPVTITTRKSPAKSKVHFGDRLTIHEKFRSSVFQ